MGAENVRLLDTAIEPQPGPDEPDPTSALFAAISRFDEFVHAHAAPAPQELASKVVTRRVMPDREILAAMSGLGAVLAVRLMLALAVIGAFWLAYLAMRTPSTMAICVLAAYAITTVGPLTYLSTKRT